MNAIVNMPYTLYASPCVLATALHRIVLIPGLPIQGDLTKRSSHPITVNRFHVDNDTSLCIDEPAYSCMWKVLGQETKDSTFSLSAVISLRLTQRGRCVLVSSAACQ